MKNILVLLMCLFSNMNNAQVKNKIDFISKFKTEIGAIFPFGRLNEKMGISSAFGFYYRFKLEHNDEMDLGLKFYFPQNTNEFTYYGNDSIYQTRSKLIGIITKAQFNKYFRVNIFKKPAELEWGSSYGFNFFMFEDKDSPENTTGYHQNDEGVYEFEIDTNSKALISPYISQSFGIRTNKLSLTVQYEFVPYNWFSKRIDKNFGNSLLGVNLGYYF